MASTTETPDPYAIGAAMAATVIGHPAPIDRATLSTWVESIVGHVVAGRLDAANRSVRSGLSVTKPEGNHR